MSCATKNISLCSIQEIADWQINAKKSVGMKVTMPAMQRGYVWSVSQVEGLWDSLVRQLPIGSFLVTRFQERLISKSRREGMGSEEPDLLLLDGQQRATSIALAFSNPWNRQNESYPMALWLDLARPDKQFIDRAFMFRLLTPVHPWGYRRSDPGRLESHVRKNAMEAFAAAIRRHKGLDENTPLPKEAKYPGLHIRYSWPWDAITPLPFPLLCAAVTQAATQGGDWSTYFRKSLDAFTFWQSPMPTTKTECWKVKLCNILEKKEGEEYSRLCILVENLLNVLTDTYIPIICVPDQDINIKLWDIPSDIQAGSQARAEVFENSPDALESLFVRINSAGTPIGGEELIYSTYKSIWPDSQELVEQIGDSAFIRPASLVALSARLVMSIEQDKKDANGKKKTSADYTEVTDSMPPALNVTRFRTLVHSPKGIYKKALQEFMEKDAKKLFLCAREFLAGMYDGTKTSLLSGQDDYRLGSILMENLARSAPDVYFFFLRWLYDKLDTHLPKDDVRKRIIGALTAIVFFSPKPEAFIRRLWPLRSDSWWQKSKLCTNKIMRMDEGTLLMPLLPQPDELEKCLKDILVSQDDQKSAWELWDWYNDLAKRYPKKNQSGYVRQCKELLESGDAKAEDARSADIAWETFWEKFWKENRLVLYAQRYWLDLFFPGYNPAAPGQQEDSDRPFDWDHIFPQGYIYNTKMSLLKMWRHDWPHTIGNIRAWPMELNRSDGKTLPVIKMADDAGTDFDPQWKNILSSGQDIRTASFVGDEWRFWAACSAKSERDVKDDLTKKSAFGSALLQAITRRLCSLYRHWYDTLDIGGTFGQRHICDL